RGKKGKRGRKCESWSSKFFPRRNAKPLTLLLSVSGTKGLGYDIPTSCCHSYTHHRLPYHLIVDFYETSSLCLKPAIVFLTSKGRQICANPKYEWVQRYILLLKQKIRTE
uniref:C-C motif chemokine 5 n=1 Tax=Monodelphis domestica TaxID=13616 RepID=K7E609_MONDO